MIQNDALGMIRTVKYVIDRQQKFHASRRPKTASDRLLFILTVSYLKLSYNATTIKDATGLVSLSSMYLL
jgi:hypothetical protein